MILVVDSGNTRIKWAVWDRGRLGTPDGCLQGEFEPERHWEALAVPSAVVMANVAAEGGVAQARAWCERRWMCSCRLLVTGARGGGVENGYDRPGSLGVDRWAALVGARRLYPGSSVCVVDAGSAITADVMDPAGRHLGGYIAPGLNMMCRVLGERTHGLPRLIAGVKSGGEPGHDTAAGIMAGAVLAAVGLIERVRARMPADGRCVITGGDAGHLLPLLARGCDHRPDLTLLGVAILAEEEYEVTR